MTGLDNDCIVQAGVAGLTLLYQSGAVSPVDVCNFYLSRIAVYDGVIGAVTHLDADGARHAAAASAARWRAAAPLSPIDGVPFLLKANIAVRGWPWHAGVAAYRNRLAHADAGSVARLRNAGVIVLGLANMHEAALGATNDNPAYGRTCNPWDPARTPGGSSGGSAAAVAAGLCAAALGTDTLGSVRVPSAYCGVFGIKPQRGLIDGTGIVPLCPDLDEPGIHARSVADAAAVLRALTDPDCPPAAPPTRIAQLDWPTILDVAPAQSDAVEQTAARARSAGIMVRPLSLPDFDFTQVRRAALLVVECGALAEHGAQLAADPDGFSAAFRAMLAWCTRQPPARVATARQCLSSAAAMLREVCSDGTLILAPSVPQQAFTWSAPVPDNQAAFTMLASIAGLAAISLPAGVHNGLPLAAQLIGQDVAALLPVAERIARPCGLPAMRKLHHEPAART